jgi:hypothetical protein
MLHTLVHAQKNQILLLQLEIGMVFKILGNLHGTSLAAIVHTP